MYRCKDLSTCVPVNDCAVRTAHHLVDKMACSDRKADKDLKGACIGYSCSVKLWPHPLGTRRRHGDRHCGVTAFSLVQYQGVPASVWRRPGENPGAMPTVLSTHSSGSMFVAVRAVIRAFLLALSYSGGVCSMGPYLVHAMQLVCIGVQIRGPY